MMKFKDINVSPSLNYLCHRYTFNGMFISDKWHFKGFHPPHAYIKIK